jgi:hypothetical protein
MEAHTKQLGGNMREVGPEHRIEYRQEVLTPFFRYIEGGDCFYVVGAASFGKTRLLDHLMKPEVQQHYLKEKADTYWLIRVDLNRMPIHELAWSFYELLVSSIVLYVYTHEDIKNVEAELIKLDSQIIERRDPLIALRLFELVVNKLCQYHDLRLSFLFDEFDETYKTLPKEIFHQLRAIRDANKYRISFILFLRNTPEKLRETRDIESFYELLNRQPLGIGPYQKEDGLQIIKQWEARKQHSISPDQREIIFHASGGHAGLMSALMSILIERSQVFQKLYSADWAKELSQDPAIVEECRKIWDGLLDEEKERLPDFITDLYKQVPAPIDTMLFAKGLLFRAKGGEVRFFSELFKQYTLSNHLKAALS